ncbi:hypothetical protein EYC84_010219 [Monilinia fructicola]|uniref:Uncharacterized protein n=1 Tax=Monilinia fructicola TaxID=38448 RepID=A0A5M9JEH1_MONFR|nr:hypothetical protein EYC84_010219 [Monilinia fructicola]
MSVTYWVNSMAVFLPRRMLVTCITGTKELGRVDLVIDETLDQPSDTNPAIRVARPNPPTSSINSGLDYHDPSSNFCFLYTMLHTRDGKNQNVEDGRHPRNARKKTKRKPRGIIAKTRFIAMRRRKSSNHHTVTTLAPLIDVPLKTQE